MMQMTENHKNNFDKNKYKYIFVLYKNLKSETHLKLLKNMLILTLKNSNRIIEVRRNQDGTLFLTANGKTPILNAGQVIKCLGGIDGVLAKCNDVNVDSINDFLGLKKDRQQELFIQNKKVIISDYNNLLSQYEVIPITLDNLRIILRYLRVVNHGLWNLPRLQTGYSANQYDCNGKIAVTIIFDEPINIGLRCGAVDKVVMGAPKGYLQEYSRIV